MTAIIQEPGKGPFHRPAPAESPRLLFLSSPSQFYASASSPRARGPTPQPDSRHEPPVSSDLRPHQIATIETGHGSIGVLHGNGIFEVLGAGSVVSVSIGVHEKEKERIQKWRAEAEKRFGRGES
jgi:hypothetical protein